MCEETAAVRDDNGQLFYYAACGGVQGAGRCGERGRAKSGAGQGAVVDINVYLIDVYYYLEVSAFDARSQ